MKCRKCGAELPRGAEKCERCGSPVQSQARPERRVSRAANPALAAKIPFLLMALALTHILQIVLWFCDTFKSDLPELFDGAVSVAGFFKVIYSDGDDMAFLKAATPLFVVIFAAAAVWALVSLLRGGRGRRMRMFFSKFAALSDIAALIFIFTVLRSAARDEGLSAGITFGGILQLVLCVGIFALTVFISYASKQKKVEPRF